MDVGFLDIEGIVLDRHIPAAELHHFTPQLYVQIIQGGPFVLLCMANERMLILAQFFRLTK